MRLWIFWHERSVVTLELKNQKNKLFRTCLVISLILASPAFAKEKFSRTQLMMGDVEVQIQIIAPAKKKETVFAAMERAFQEASRVESAVSEWQPTSQTTLLNKMAGRQPIPIGKDLMTILLYSIRASLGTHGAFDVTFASQLPDASYQDMALDPRQGTAWLKRRRVRVGVSGIAKGYIVDRMASVLRDAGFQDFLVRAGGDLYASGTDQKGKWKIAVQNPFGPNRVVCEFYLKNRAASTSGIYERGPHILDPKTRRPAETDLASATVIAPRTIESDAMATGVFVLGLKEGSRLLAQMPAGGGLLVDQRGAVLAVGDFSCLVAP